MSSKPTIKLLFIFLKHENCKKKKKKINDSLELRMYFNVNKKKRK